MKKSVLITISACTVMLLGSCAKEYNAVYRSSDYAYRYEYAKECFANGQYTRATTLLTDVITPLKGTDNGQESLYMLGMAQFCDRDYESAAATFKRYITSYPRGVYNEMASYYIGESLFESTPEPRLDQSQTVNAIAAFQEYLDLYPDAKLKAQAQQRLFDLQDKLVKKELYSAQLYYDLGAYFGNCGNDGGNNYSACIVTAQNALKDYPYTKLRENFAVLIMKSKYELAGMSVDAKQLERYQDAEDEAYGFINEYPDSKDRPMAEKFIKNCKNFIEHHAHDVLEETRTDNADVAQLNEK